jgi:acyl carrier protein
VEDLKLDSLHLLTLATEVEDHFLICLDEEDEAALETVGDLVNMVEKKLAG